MAVPQPVSDPADPRLHDYTDLTDVALRRRREPAEGLFIAEGEKVIRRALEAGYTLRSLLLSEKWLGVMADVVEAADAPVLLVTPAFAEQVTGYHVHRGALAAVQRKPLPEPARILAEVRREDGPEGIGGHPGADGSAPRGAPSQAGGVRRSRVAVLENLVDHANVGSAFRNAAALGIDAILATPRCADPLYRRAVKTSMGNVFHVPWTRTAGMPETLDMLRAHGYTTVALTLSDDAVTLDELVARDLPALALVFGTEGAGVDPLTARQADLRVRIPMEAGVDSLNVAAATAVTFYATR
ncbi:TrmH family RNA methyltransferase [Streptomyces diastaticus]